MALTLLGTVIPITTFRTRLTTDHAHPSWWACTLPGHVVADASILAGASLLTLRPVLPRGAEILTEGSGISRRTSALSSHVVTGGSILTLTFLMAVISICPLVTALLAAPPFETRRTVAGTSDGVAQGSVFALTAAAAVRSPVVTVAGTGAVGSSPARLTLTGVWSNTTTMDTFVSTVRDTHFPAFIKSRAALGFTPVHCFFTMSVGSTVADSVSCALKPV